MELNKTNINKLLKGRKVVDAQRANKVAARNQYEKTDYEQMQTKFDEHLWNREVALKNLGFVNYDDFRTFNDNMCIEELQSFMPLISMCDHCKGYGGTAPCVNTCSRGDDQAAYFYTWTGSPDQIQGYWKMVLKFVQSLKYADDLCTIVEISPSTAAMVHITPGMVMSQDTINILSLCPTGHGWRYQYKRHPQFDISWK